MSSFELANEQGLRLRGLTFGATLTSLTLPLVSGRREVLLGCDDHRYPEQQVWLGAVAGRFANRIGGARLVHGDQQWQLDANQAPHCLHGGSGGFHRRDWLIVKQSDDAITLMLHSANGDQGFPGNLTVLLTYQLSEHDLLIQFEATSDAATPVSLTSHVYFNLDGGGDIRGHHISINADHRMSCDEHGLPTAIVPVSGVFDLRPTRQIGDDWLSHPQQRQAKGYDHPYLLNTLPGQWAAKVCSQDSQVTMEVYTDQPSLQFYSGNWLAGTPGRNGQILHDYDGFCLEAQQLPDSPNRPEFGDPWLHPGQRYQQQTRYRFRYD